MELIEFGPDESGRIADYVAVHAAVDAVDAPWSPPFTAYRCEMEMRHRWDGEPARWFLAYEAGRPVGSMVLFTSEYDNLELGWFALEVHPDERRRGLGTAILERAVALSVEMGRPLVAMDGIDSDAADRFAKSVGFAFKQHNVIRRQTMGELPDIEALHAQASQAAGDYELVRTFGYSPDDVLDDLAAATAAINDAPTDDLEFEDEVYDAGRIKAYETAQIEGGHRFYRVVARHRESNEIAGLTVVAVDIEQPAYADQHDTSVVARHRGHRLGMLLKTEMLLWLREAEPGLKFLTTYNAQSNDHMIGVNEALGYRVLARDAVYQARAGSAECSPASATP